VLVAVLLLPETRGKTFSDTAPLPAPTPNLAAN